MRRFIGGRSGFQTVRDFLFFLIGMGIDVYHIITTQADKISWQVLIFGAGLAGAPLLFNPNGNVEEEDKPPKKKTIRRTKNEPSDKWAQLPFKRSGENGEDV